MYARRSAKTIRAREEETIRATEVEVNTGWRCSDWVRLSSSAVEAGGK